MLSCYVKWREGFSSGKDTERIDRVLRVHAQKHFPSSKQNWGRADKKHWICKSFQSNSYFHQKYHEVNGHLNRHVCAFCLTLGKQLGHSEKNCMTKNYYSKKQTQLFIARMGQLYRK